MSRVSSAVCDIAAVLEHSHQGGQVQSVARSLGLGTPGALDAAVQPSAPRLSRPKAGMGATAAPEAGCLVLSAYSNVSWDTAEDQDLARRLPALTPCIAVGYLFHRLAPHDGEIPLGIAYGDKGERLDMFRNPQDRLNFGFIGLVTGRGHRAETQRPRRQHEQLHRRPNR